MKELEELKVLIRAIEDRYRKRVLDLETAQAKQKKQVDALIRANRELATKVRVLKSDNISIKSELSSLRSKVSSRRV